MGNIIINISTILILIAYIGYYVFLLINNKQDISESTGFNVCKDIISEYNSINVIESKKFFSIYNIKRKVIKLSTKSYYGKDLSSISLSLIEAGYSVLHDKNNKYIKIFEKLHINIKLLYILPIIALIFSKIFYSIADIKIGLVLLILCCFISYILIDLKTQIYNWLCDNLKNVKDINKTNRLKVLSFINNIMIFDKLILFGEIIIVFKFIMTLLGII